MLHRSVTGRQIQQVNLYC